MDQQQVQNINQASKGLTESARQAFQMLADRTVSLQESNLRLTQDFFQNWIQTLQSQTEGNRQAAQTVQEQSERQQQALQTLTQESTNAYSEFLNSALSFYQETLRSATQVTQDNMQTAQEGHEPTVLGYTDTNRAAAIQLIDELLAADPGYDEETWPEIAEALDRDRLSARRLFVD